MASVTVGGRTTPSGSRIKSTTATPTSQTSQKLPANRKRKSDAPLPFKAGKNEDYATSSTASPSTVKRRKTITTPASTPGGKAKLTDLTGDDDEEFEIVTPSKKKRTKTAAPGQDEEKRLKMFRNKAPLSYLEKLNRALTQRMFVIDRTRGGTEEYPEETIDIAGTTGNIYNVNIGKLPTCTCPDNKKGNQCKHIIYVLHNVLKAPDHLQYQLAFLSSELHQIFQNAPPSPSDKASHNSNNDNDHPGKRKAIDGDCPICFTEFEPDTEDIVWCKAACGNNIHKTCFEQWAASQKGKEVKCVYCRTPWQGDEESMKRISKNGTVNEEGYMNVASELGLSGRRDYSSYHQPWVRRNFGYY
ncbi:MAG: hypothetical protein M1830_009183 [Pleopsidium flavum]|nr:MAG: hypothetical protein M1830_009183 [Pleopsidium flavum]